MDDRVKELVDKLNKLREKYYNDSSDIDDEEFDFYERELKTLDPNNSYFDQVGSNISSNEEEVEHKIPMLSMQKVQTAEEADKWIRFMGVPFVWVEPKFDGISGKIVYDSNGDFLYGATRGNGLVGAKIKYASEINFVPKHFYPNCELRGEFIINKYHKSEFPDRPLRNVCGGILHRLDYSDDIKYIDFAIYDVHVYNRDIDIFKDLDRVQKLSKIKELIDPVNFQANVTQIDKAVDIYVTYDKYVEGWRDDWLYETDGIILTVPGNQLVYDQINSRYKITSYNRYNMALKPPAVACESEIVGIDISVNRRKISYVALVKPVKLLNTTVSRATLDNYQKVVKNKVGIGTTVLIKKANEIIPKVFNFYNKHGKEIIVPNMEYCPICGSKLVPIYQDVMCPNEYGCIGVYASKIENVFDNLDVKNIGIKAIEFIAKALSKKIGKLYLSSFFSSLIVSDDGHYLLEWDINEYYNGGKRPEIFKEAILKMFNNLTEIKILGSFNIPYISEQSLINHKICSYDDLLKYVEKLDKLPVLTEVFDSTLYTWFKVPNNVEDLERTMELLKPFCKKYNNDDGSYITYCISGAVPENFKNKSDFENFVISKNYLYKRVDDVSMNTGYLVTNERNTTKVIKAKKYGIKTLSFDEFLNII